MSYMGLFWETGLPAAWALSRKSEERPVTDAAAEPWPRSFADFGMLSDPAHGSPGDSAGRPVPEPDGEKTKG